MSGQTRVTIAGAGALGLSCALALADAGARVTVCDPADPTANASGVAGGMIAPAFEAVLDPEAREHFAILLAARDLWAGLADRAGVRLDRSGALAVGSDTWLGKVAAGFADLGLHPAELAHATAEAMAPGLSPAFPRALLTREDWRIAPAAALMGLRRAAEAAGVEFRREAASGPVPGEILVVATGAGRGLSNVAPELSRLSPIKGHIARAAAAPGAVTVRGEGVYVTPADGGVAIGATMEAGRDDTEIEPGKAEPLRRAAVRLFPHLAEAPLEIAAGVRGATPDGLPMVGWSETPGVLLAVGARRNGWLLAPLVGQVAAACAVGRDPGPYGARFDPARFRPATRLA